MVGERGPRGRILVVGAGYAGLTTAIELSRKNFEVEVIESASKLTTQGKSCWKKPDPTQQDPCSEWTD